MILVKKKLENSTLFIFYVKICPKMMFGDILNTKLVSPGYIIDWSAELSFNNY